MSLIFWKKHLNGRLSEDIEVTRQLWKTTFFQKHPGLKPIRVLGGYFNNCSRWWFQILVFIGQVKQYFAYKTQHQHGAFAKTGGFKYFLEVSSLFGEDEPILTSIFFRWVETTNQIV